MSSMKLLKKLGCDVWGVVFKSSSSNLYLSFMLNKMMKQKSLQDSLWQWNKYSLKLKRMSDYWDKLLVSMEEWLGVVDGLDLSWMPLNLWKSQKELMWVSIVDTSVDGRDRTKKLSFFGKMLYYWKLVMYFYHVHKKKDFDNVMWGVMCSNESMWSDSMYFELESWLFILVYSMHFSESVFEAMDMVWKGYIMVNKEVVIKPGYLVYVGDIVEMVDYKKKEFMSKLVESIEMNKVCLGYPAYLEMNYGVMGGMMYKKLTSSEVVFPFWIDLEFFNKYYFSKI